MLYYRNVPKFSDTQVWAKSADPDQTAPRAVWSGSALFAILSASLCIFWMHYSKEKPSCSIFRVVSANFQVTKILGFLRYSCYWQGKKNTITIGKNYSNHPNSQDYDGFPSIHFGWARPKHQFYITSSFHFQSTCISGNPGSIYKFLVTTLCQTPHVKSESM